MVTYGSGQLSLWEDIALKEGNIKTLKKLRDNIEVFAKNSGEAVTHWNKDKNIDALIIWKHWKSKDSQFIQAGKNNVIYRVAEVVIANDTKNKDLAYNFLDFIQSDNAQKVWQEQGWIANK